MDGTTGGWCPLCGVDRSLRHVRSEPASADGRHSERMVEVVQCRTCSFAFVRRDFPASLVESDYAEHTGGDIPATAENLGWWMQNTEQSFRWILDEIDDEPRGPLLDVGCGRGAFLVFARDRGWDVTGMELNTEYVDFIETELHIPTFNGTLDHPDLPADHYAVISLLDVIEHLYDPVSALRSCATLLRPGGLLLLKTPNWRAQLVKEQAKRVLKRGPGHVAYLGHINQFSARTLEQAAAAAGLRPAFTRPAATFLPGMRGAGFELRRGVEYGTKWAYNAVATKCFDLLGLNVSFNLLTIARRDDRP